MQFSDQQILLVDDEYEMRILLSRALEIAGFRTQQAASGEEALHLLNNQDFDLLILDLKMPKMDGIEVMSRVRELDVDLDIIIITAAPSIESAVIAIRQEASDYLLKPITIKQLIDSVNSTLHKRQKRLQKDRINRTLETTMSLGNGSLIKKHLPDEIVLGQLLLDRSQHLFIFLENDQREINLTRGETAVLSSLMMEPGRVFSCAQLAKQAWDYNLPEGEAQSVVRPYISRLRSKLEPEAIVPQLIITVRGNGYYLNPSGKRKKI